MAWQVIKFPSNGALPKVLFSGSESPARNAFTTEYLKGKRGRLVLKDGAGRMVMDTADLRKVVTV